MLLSNIISFDGIGLGPFNIDRVAVANLFNLGIDIYWYAIIITSGLVLAILFAMSQAKKVGLKSDNVIDVALIGVPLAIVGARLYYILFKLEDFNSFYDIINIRNGGLAIYGGIIGGFLGGIIYTRVKKINMLALFDLGAFGFLIGQTIGRWGNFFNAEAYGYITDLPWGMTINGKGPFHPTFLYESALNIVGFIALFIYFRAAKKRKNGEIFFLYFIWYGIVRAFVEGFRQDSLYLFNIRVSQLLSIILAVGGIIFFILLKVGLIDRWAEEYTSKKKAEEESYQEIYKPLLESLPQNYEADDETVQRSLEGVDLNDENSPAGLYSMEEARAFFEQKAAEKHEEEKGE